MDAIGSKSIPLNNNTPVKRKPCEDEGVWKEIKDNVSESVSDFRIQGKKYGTFAAAVAGAAEIPYVLANALPSLSGILLGPVGIMASVILVAIEEKNIGIGKHLAGAAGAALGAGIGLVKTAANHVNPSHSQDGSEKIILPKEAPTGKEPKEALIPSLLHKAEKSILGYVPERNKTVEFGESIGSTIATAIGAAIVPGTVAALMGGPVGMVLGTMVGSILGMVCGSFEESTIGAGRAAGEIAGNIITEVKKHLKKSENEAEKVEKTADKKVEPKTELKTESNSLISEKIRSPLKKAAGILGKAFMNLNSAMAEPIMGFIIDTSSLLNLFLHDKPVMNMEFLDRPMPSVNRERLVENFTKIAGINAKYKAESAVSEELQKKFSDLKVETKVDEIGNLMAVLPASKGKEDSPTVLFSAHMDTVSSTSSDSIINDGLRIKTNEKHILGGDDRAGIAEIMEGLETVIEKGMDHPEIKIVFTVGEEVGLIGASSLKPEDISSKPTLGYVVDSMNKSTVHLTNDAVFIAPRSKKYNFSQEDPVIQLGMRSLADAGIEPIPVHGPILTGAASDANTTAFNSGNIRSIAIGTGVSEVHSCLENVKIKDLEQVAKAVVGLMTNACDLKIDENQKIVPRYPIQA